MDEGPWIEEVLHLLGLRRHDICMFLPTNAYLLVLLGATNQRLTVRIRPPTVTTVP